MPLYIDQKIAYKSLLDPAGFYFFIYYIILYVVAGFVLGL